MTLLAAFKVLLARLSGQTDVAVGVPIAGRNHPQSEDLVGIFLNTLVLRTDMSGNPAFTDLITQVREDTVIPIATTVRRTLDRVDMYSVSRLERASGQKVLHLTSYILILRVNLKLANPPVTGCSHRAAANLPQTPLSGINYLPHGGVQP